MTAIRETPKKSATDPRAFVRISKRAARNTRQRSAFRESHADR